MLISNPEVEAFTLKGRGTSSTAGTRRIHQVCSKRFWRTAYLFEKSSDMLRVKVGVLHLSTCSCKGVNKHKFSYPMETNICLLSGRQDMTLSQHVRMWSCEVCKCITMLTAMFCRDKLRSTNDVIVRLILCTYIYMFSRDMAIDVRCSQHARTASTNVGFAAYTHMNTSWKGEHDPLRVWETDETAEAARCNRSNRGP